MLLFWVLSLLLFGLCSGEKHEGFSANDYYKMVDDISKGVDYYKLLGIAEDATPVEVKKAYKKLAVKWFVRTL